MDIVSVFSRWQDSRVHATCLMVSTPLHLERVKIVNKLRHN